MNITDISRLANGRRQARQDREKSQRAEQEAGASLVAAIAAWKKVPADQIKLSNVSCLKAPADLHCVYVQSWNPMTNPCVFCGGPEEDVF